MRTTGQNSNTLGTRCRNCGGFQSFGAAGDSDGEVEFRAYYRSTDPDLPGTRVLHERSRFTVRAGRWFYLDDGMDPD